MNSIQKPARKQGFQENASKDAQENLRYSQDTRKKLVLEKAQTFGAETTLLVLRIWSRAAIVAYLDCLDVLRCARQYSPARLERAACQSIALGFGGAQTVRSILAGRLDMIAGTNGKDSNDVQFLLPFMGELLDAESSKRA